MFDQLIAKTATAAATVKAAPKARTVRAATPAKVKAAPAAKVANAIKFAIGQGFRPKAGAALKAQTSAFLNLSGMATGGAFPKAGAVKVIGARAVQYHMENGNFEQSEDGLLLSDKGAFLFTLYREADPELVKAFETFFKTGALNEAIGVKNAAVVVKL